MKQELQKPLKHILKKHQIAGFTLAEALYPPKLKQPRHTHQLASFSFVLAGGNYIENYGNRPLTRQPSTIIFHPPQESHTVDFQDKAVRILSVYFDFKRLAYIRELSVIMDSSVSHRTKKIACLGYRIHEEFNLMDNASVLAIEGLIFEIIAEASRSKVATSERKSPRWLKQAKQFLHDNFLKSLSFEDVAKVADVHPVHLARVFRKQNGCTLGEYVRRLRVEFACQKISSTENSLSEIAFSVGFADQSHFTKTFKRHVGLTPSEYRRNSR